MDKPLPQTLPDGSLSEEREAFERWYADYRKVQSIILASMSNDMQKQYDRMDDVTSILQCMKEVYAIPDRNTRYVATKEFIRAKMTEGSSVQEHGVKMLSLVEKLEDLKAGLDNDTYVDVILQLLPPSYDPFIVNFNMNGLEKSINKLINMLVQYEATIKKSVPSVLIGEALTSEAKDKRAGRQKRKKGKAKVKTIVIAKDAKSASITLVGISKGKRRIGTQQDSRANDICAHYREKEHWKRDCPNLSSNQGMFVVEVNMITNSTSWVLNTSCGAHICNDLQVLQRSKKLNKDEVVLRLGDGEAVAVEAVGIINLVISDRVRLELKDGYFVPSFIKNIISIPLLDNVGFEFLINKNCFYLMKDGSSHMLGKLNNALYILQKSDWIMTAQNKRKLDNLENAQIWHARLGHISQDRMNRLVDSKSLKIDNLDNLPAYESCLKGKMTRKSFVGQNTLANGLFDLIHTDVCGLLNTQARGGFSYFITFIDDHSRYGYVYMMRVMRLRQRLGYYFYDPSEQKVLFSRNAVLLERGFPTYTQRDELLLKESSEEPQSNAGTSFTPTISTDNVPILRRSARVPQPPERFGFLGMNGQLDNDPKTYGEAMLDIDLRKWLESMKSQMDSMSSNQVWTLVDRPKGVRPVGCKWVYKRKIGADREVTTFKARLVAKGYTQRLGMDVTMAFLNGFIEEEIYTDQPDGFTVVGEEQKNDFGPCVYKKVSGSSVFVLVLYVDDILLIGNEIKMLGDTKAWLSTQFSMKDLGEASYILGIKIFRDRFKRILGMTQNSYVEKVLKTLEMKHSKRGFIPMRHRVKLSKKQSPKPDEELKRMLDTQYASVVGSIQYVAQCTRPDIAYALSVTSIYQTCVGEAHWTAANTILKYLKRTKDVFLVYSGGELILEGFSDASF
ncbi:Retrovirus-related Pol polyprotein from transposon TNT 1-94 [Sesamum angolense]|uniref:Retrovirus-related Pol polyprotein from transposon TNT 1-94 n=1 Tax=Sesamum angolense TaxID=2727404 RepID=A0AAE2C3Y9_9LAMI|nr:Retrovirus-related Pol polyprotein from transposon TNT 1-94 [Sesamum angolense]